MDLDDLIRDTLADALAVSRFKKTLVRVGSEAAGLPKSVFIDVLTEATRKTIWPE